MSSFYRSSDYAGLSMGYTGFHYGYEVTVPYEGQDKYEYEDEGGEWCFTADINDVKITIPFSELNERNMFDVQSCLWAGVTKIFEKYELVEKEV